MCGFQVRSVEYTQDEAIAFLLENAPDVIWTKEDSKDTGLTWVGIDKSSGQVKYSASTYLGYHGSANLEINRGTKAEFYP